MYMKRFLILFTQLASYSLCMKITIGGQEVTLEVLPATHEEVVAMNGGDAFVRLGTVKTCPQDFSFNVGTTVAIEFARSNRVDYLKNESNVYEYIRRKNQNFKGMPIVEELGTAEISETEGDELKIPAEELQNNFTVLVMQRLFKDLLTIILDQNLPGVPHDCLQKIITQLVLKRAPVLGQDTILQDLRAIGVVHGDIKPANIMLVEENNFDGGVCLCDFGYSFFPDYPRISYGGDLTYRSDRMMRNANANTIPANSDDDEFSLAWTGISLSRGYIPWSKMVTELENETDHKQFLAIWSDIAAMKKSFTFSAYVKYDIVDTGLKEELTIRLTKVRNQGLIAEQNEAIKTDNPQEIASGSWTASKPKRLGSASKQPEQLAGLSLSAERIENIKTNNPQHIVSSGSSTKPKKLKKASKQPENFSSFPPRSEREPKGGCLPQKSCTIL